MEIVKFKNGKFGIRKRDFLERLFNLTGVFRDFKPTDLGLVIWRKPSDKYFIDCQVDNIDEAKDMYQRIKGDIVDAVIK